MARIRFHGFLHFIYLEELKHHDCIDNYVHTCTLYSTNFIRRQLSREVKYKKVVTMKKRGLKRIKQEIYSYRNPEMHTYINGEGKVVVTPDVYNNFSV